MVIYWDIIVFFNFMINFIFLFSMEMLFKDKICFLRLVLVSLLSAIITLFCFFNKYLFRLYKIFGGMMLVILGLKKITFSKQIIKISMFYVENLALIGILTTFKINSFLMLVIAVALILALLFFEHFKNYYIFIAKNKYNVIVSKNNIHIKIKAVLDTGNTATNKDGIPLVFVSDKWFNNTFNEYELVLVETVNGEKYCRAYQVDDFLILINKKKVEKKALIVFTKLEEDCLLNSMLLI